LSEHVIPFEDLPPGFGEGKDPPVDPAPLRPAATIVLLRPGKGGTEILLLRRNRSSGFVPGAWVFPGGRVDGQDADPALVERLDGITPEQAADRLAHAGMNPPAVAFLLAAAREAFEETGILVGHPSHSPDAAPPASEFEAPGDPVLLAARDDLLEERAGFAEVLDRLGCRVAGARFSYIAHWITPEAEPRRYDTRFFAAAVPAGTEVSPDPREMTGALWLTADEALRRNRDGSLPMVFPTLKTLESLRPFATPDAALARLGSAPVRPIMPRLVRTPTGIGMEIPE
jgi:8-oxo-dGTP pyrophosphatase MutT (NUDIX family)